MKRLVLAAAAFCSTTGHALPVFESVTEQLGMGMLKDRVNIYPDSELSDIFYVVPTAFSAGVELLSVIPPELQYLPPEKIEWIREQNHAQVVRKQQYSKTSYSYSFALFPKVTIQEAIAFVRSWPGNIDSGTMECLSGDVSFNGIPRNLFSSIRVTPIVFDLKVFDGETETLPKGYIYEVQMITESPEVVESALMRLGAKGMVSLDCHGFAGRSSTQPSRVQKAISVDATFRRVRDLDREAEPVCMPGSVWVGKIGQCVDTNGLK